MPSSAVLCSDCCSATGRQGDRVLDLDLDWPLILFPTALALSSPPIPATVPVVKAAITYDLVRGVNMNAHLSCVYSFI